MTRDYSPEEQQAGQRVMVTEGLFSRAMEAMTGGVILAGFALALGANDLEVGLLASIPFLAQLINLPAVALLARTQDRRLLCAVTAAAARVLWFAMAAVPFLALPVRPILVLIVLLLAAALLASLSGAAWQTWVRDLVPRREMGTYFGRRLALLSIAGLVVTLAAGQFVTMWRTAMPERGVQAYGILFAAAGVVGLIGAYVLTRAPMIPATLVTTDLRAALKKPLKDGNFRRLLVFLAAWGFAANFSLPFVSIVLLRTLGYPLAVAVAFAALSTAANVVALRMWAPVTDRYGNKPVLALGASVFVIAIFLWALTPKEAGTLALASAGVVHVLLGFAAAALDLASNNLVLKLAPDTEGAAYLATASVAKSVATGIAPLLGGLMGLLLTGRSFSVRFAFSTGTSEQVVTALRFAHYDFLFLVSALLGLYALHRLLGFVEEGEAPPSVVARALRRDVSGVSSVAGMRQFTHLASYLAEAAYRVERSLDVRRAFEDEDEGEGP